MSTLISPTSSAPTSNRFLNRQTLVTALALTGAIAIRFSSQYSVVPSATFAENTKPEASPNFYLAFNELKQMITALAEDATGNRS